LFGLTNIPPPDLCLFAASFSDASAEEEAAGPLLVDEAAGRLAPNPNIPPDTDGPVAGDDKEGGPVLEEDAEAVAPVTILPVLPRIATDASAFSDDKAVSPRLNESSCGTLALDF
jgi:hypothetical protein